MTFRPQDLGERLRAAIGIVSGQAILAVGGVLILVLVVTALLSDRVGSAAGSGTSAVGMPPAPAAAVTAALPGLTPFTRPRLMQFGGRITQIASIGNDMGWGQVHIWIDDGTGAVREVSVAPQSYLTQIGCPSLNNVRVNGTGFQFDMAQPNAGLYAKTLVVGGQTCNLRDDEGLALWMNAG